LQLTTEVNVEDTNQYATGLFCTRFFDSVYYIFLYMVCIIAASANNVASNIFEIDNKLKIFRIAYKNK